MRKEYMTVQWLVITAPLSPILSFKANIQALPAKRTAIAEQVHVWEATLPVTAGILMLYHFIGRPRVVYLFLRTAAIMDLEVFGNFC